MCILLIEHDPLVRTDMAQALQSNFADRDLICADTLTSENLDGVPSVVILDHFSSDELQLQTRQTWESNGTAFIWSGSSRHAALDHWLRLSRPFTEAMLIEVVRKALDQEPAGA